MLVLPGDSSAGNCGIVRHQAALHHGHAVHQQAIAVPVHGPAYHHDYQARVVYHIGAQIRDEAYEAKIRQDARAELQQELAPLLQKLEAVDQRVANLLKFRGQGTFEFAGDAAAGSTVSPRTAQAPAAASSGNSVTQAAAGWSTAEAKVLADRCLSCHSGSAPRGGLDLTVPPSLETLRDCFERMMSDVPGYRMPPDGDRPSDAEIGLIFAAKERALAESLKKQGSSE